MLSRQTQWDLPSEIEQTLVAPGGETEERALLGSERDLEMEDTTSWFQEKEDRSMGDERESNYHQSADTDSLLRDIQESIDSLNVVDEPYEKDHIALARRLRAERS